MTAMSQHCQKVYEAMDELATTVAADEGETMRVYEGALTRLFTKLGFSTPYYSKITTIMIDLGCIRQLRRGGGGSASQWWLIRPPVEMEVNEYAKEVKTKADPNTQMARDLISRIAQLEQDMIAVKAMVGWDDRVLQGLET